MGPKKGQVAPLVNNDLLASTKGCIPKTISVSAEAVGFGDDGIMPLGTVLVLATSGDDEGLYREHDDADAGGEGLGDEATAVVLAHNIEQGEAVDGKIKAAAYIAGVLKADKLLVNDAENFDWDKCPRLIRWPLG